MISAFSVSCQKKNTTLVEFDEVRLVENLRGDSLVLAIRANFKELGIFQLTEPNSVDIDFVNNFLASNLNNHDLCKDQDQYKSHFADKDSEFAYLTLLCTESLLLERLEAKYPLFTDLSHENRKNLLYAGAQLSLEESLLIKRKN